MTTTRALILEGPNGQSFFFKETLLGEDLIDQVNLVGRADIAMDLVLNTEPYDLIVINLVEAWDQGMKLGLWLSQQDLPCPTMLIISSELEHPIPSNGASVVLSEPLSLRDFANSVRNLLQPNKEGINAQIQNFPRTSAGEPSWSGETLQQEYAGYWSPFSTSFLS